MSKTFVENKNKCQVGPPRHCEKGLEVRKFKVPSHCSFRPNLHEL
jgi:hypothetical protein